MLFRSNTYVTANSTALNNFISNTLDNNPVYNSNGISSSRDYVGKNNYVTGYGLTPASLDPYSNSKDMQDLAEIRIAATKTMLLNSKIVD